MLLETIRIENGTPLHLAWHQRRFDRSRAEHFGASPPIDLRSHIIPPHAKGTFKCRLRYAREIVDITYTPYQPRPVRILQCVEGDFSYDYKYADRGEIDTLFSRRGQADDVLIIRRDMVTDTSIANIAFLSQNRWFTPKHPLLRGTTRERLIRNGFLIPRDIPVDRIPTFERFALLNAMIGFQPVKYGKILPIRP